MNIRKVTDNLQNQIDSQKKEIGELRKRINLEPNKVLEDICQRVKKLEETVEKISKKRPGRPRREEENRE